MIPGGRPPGDDRPTDPGRGAPRGASPPEGTERRVETADELDALRFDERGLVPVVAQEAEGGRVLMVAWANRDALERTLETGLAHYWSRSRNALWRKGETSGNIQEVVSLHADCDGDTVLARVRPRGPACHTGEPTCFGRGSEPVPLPSRGAPKAPGTSDERPGIPPSSGGGSVLRELWAQLEDRRRERPEGSYTTRLLDDPNLRVKKLGEETAELLAALVRSDDTVVEEAADLLYHLMVALLASGRDWDEVEDALARRRHG